MSSLRDDIHEHLKVYQAIRYKEMVALSKKHGRKVGTANRYLQNDRDAGRQWGFLVLDVRGKLVHGREPWIVKKLTKQGRRYLKSVLVLKK